MEDNLGGADDLPPYQASSGSCGGRRCNYDILIVLAPFPQLSRGPSLPVNVKESYGLAHRRPVQLAAQEMPLISSR